MFGLFSKTRIVEPAPVEEASPAVEPQVSDQPCDQTGLLQSWMSLAALQQQLINALLSETGGVSEYVEQEAGALSERFQRLAASARRQTGHVDGLADLAAGIESGGVKVPIVEIADLLTTTLGSVVEKILLLSKDSMTMVYVLEGIGANVERVRDCIDRLDKINRTTNMLALNARIEAERAGTAGAAFRVVAGEVRDLSLATQSLFTEMDQELGTMVGAVDDGKATLKRVATIDLSQNILAKARLEELLAALVTRGEALEAIVSAAANDASVISQDISSVVTGLQFQDRTSQRLKHISDALLAMDEACAEMASRTAPFVEGAEVSPDAHSGNIKRLLDSFTMTEVRERFATKLGETGASDAAASEQPPDASETGSIELF